MTAPTLTGSPPPVGAPLVRRRRTLLRRSFVVLGVMVLAIPVALLLLGVGDDDWLAATTVAGLREKRVVYLAEHQVFVVHTERGPLAMSARSSHLGDRAVYCPFSQTFEEVHGSKWDRLGRYLDGPASRGLYRVAVRVSFGAVEINPEMIERGPPRDVHGARPTGRFCEIPGPERPPGFAAQPYDPSDDPF